MTFRAQIFLFLLVCTTNAQEAPRAIQVTEPPEPLQLSGQDRVISSTQQFRILGGEPADRANLAHLAENTKTELYRLTEEKDEWKVPITITLHGKPGDPLPTRTESIQLHVSEVGYDLRLDFHLSRGIEPDRLTRAVTSALVYERSLRNLPAQETDKPFHVPPWLTDGLREATAWRLGQSDRKLYAALFKTGGLFKIDEIFALKDEGFENLDAAMRAAFRVSSGALVMALLQQPQGKQGFRTFLTDVAAFEGEPPALLRKHFPELNQSETSLRKWWALQLANIGGQNLLSDVLTISETETALSEALRLDFRNPEGAMVQMELNSWPDLAALNEAERAKSVRLAQDALIRLSFRCFPAYRPLISEYQIVLSSISKNKTQEVANQLTALGERRHIMVEKATRARDYLDYFEISRARETSGVFNDYMRLKDRLESTLHRRTDPLSEYLNRMDTIFCREAEPFSQPRPLVPSPSQ